MNYTLYLQLPKPEKIEHGTFSAGDKQACFFYNNENSGVVLHHPEIVHANADGIFIRGYEEGAPTKTGRKTFKYQEWWLVYEETK